MQLPGPVVIDPAPGLPIPTVVAGPFVPHQYEQELREAFRLAPRREHLATGQDAPARPLLKEG
eukprot:9516630-Lingulodinium_polyedra.AAC.1